MKNYIDFVKSYLKENKAYFVAGLVYLLFCVVLYFFLPFTEEQKQQFFLWAKQYISNFASYMHNPLQMWVIIFVNNSLIFFLTILSWFFLSFFGMLLTVSQVIKILIVTQLAVEKVWIMKTVLSMLPHWVFEITAFVLALWLMFKITVLIIKKVWNWKKVKISDELKNVFKFFFLFIIPLTAFAALIETFITPLFI